MKRIYVLLLSAALLAPVALVAFGVDDSRAGTPDPADAAIRAAILKIAPSTKIDAIRPSVIPGFREVVMGGTVAYGSEDGKYLFQGTLINLATRENLTSSSEAALRRAILDGVGRDRRIVFAPPNPKYRVTVFTDIDCAYCRKLHSQIDVYNKEGIAVEYMFFPRAGLNSESYTKAVNVWCSDNRQQALTDAKLDKPIARKTCPNPVAMEYDLGERVGIDGTPAIYAADGTQIGGYLSPQDLLAKLDQKARQAAK